MWSDTHHSLWKTTMWISFVQKHYIRYVFFSFLLTKCEVKTLGNFAFVVDFEICTDFNSSSKVKSLCQNNFRMQTEANNNMKAVESCLLLEITWPNYFGSQAAFSPVVGHTRLHKASSLIGQVCPISRSPPSTWYTLTDNHTFLEE